MKTSLMQAPPIYELFSQKLIQSSHLKKLQQLKNHRKTQLGFDKNRASLIQSIRIHKAKSFANNYNKGNNEIIKRNIQFVSKLQRVKPAFLPTSRINRSDLNTSSLSHKSRISLRQKTKEQQTTKQNHRLFMKLKKVSSSINSNKILQDHTRAEKIKQRLMRYSTDTKNPLKIQLKSQRYIKTNPISSSNVTPRENLTHLSLNLKPKSMAQFYNKQQILKNKIIQANNIKNPQKKAYKSLARNDQNSQCPFLTVQEQKNNNSRKIKFFKNQNQILQKKKYSNILYQSQQLKKQNSKSICFVPQRKITTNKIINKLKH